MVLTTHQPMLVGFAYMAAGVLVILLSLQWDLKLPIVQLLTTGAAEAVLLVLWGFAGVQVTPGLLLLSVVRVSVTMASVPLARRLVPIVVPGFVK